MRHLLIIGLALLMACTPEAEDDQDRPQGPARISPQTAIRAAPDTAAAVARFAAVVDRIKPAAVATCRAQAPRAKCNFKFTVDNRADAPPNAYQTVERKNGRPVIAFTLQLISQLRGEDEMAFILGHEAAHHIKGHLPVTRGSVLSGSLNAGLKATLAGKDEKAVERAAAIGALRAVQGFSKKFELEADALGAIIAHRAGFDALRGAAYFSRIPSPRNTFLSTHPPNAQRRAAVRRAIAGL